MAESLRIARQRDVIPTFDMVANPEYDLTPEPVSGPDDPMYWAAHSTFNTCVVDETRAVVRATSPAVLPKKFHGSIPLRTSLIGVAEGEGGHKWKLRRSPLTTELGPYETGLGQEDTRISKVGNLTLAYYNSALWLPEEDRIHVSVSAATIHGDFEDATFHGPIIDAAPDSHSMRVKATAAWDTPSGDIWRAVSIGTEFGGGGIFVRRFSDPEQLLVPERIGSYFDHYDQRRLIGPSDKRTRRGPELGAPPLLTERGRLFFFCPEDVEPDKEAWGAAAMLTDLEDPRKIIGIVGINIVNDLQLAEHLQEVSNANFPSGALIKTDEVTGRKIAIMYYGKDDKNTASAECDLEDLLDAIESSPYKQPYWPI